MKNSRPKLNGWQARVPTADAALRESVVRVTANRPGTWGFVLAEVRACRKWSLATQVMALSVSESELVFLESLMQADTEQRILVVLDRVFEVQQRTVRAGTR